MTLLHSAILHLVILLALTAGPGLAESHLYVDPDSCNVQDTAFVYRALLDVNEIANAALNALSQRKEIDDFPNPAFPFFGPKPPRYVRAIYQAAVAYTRWIRLGFDATAPNAQLRGNDFDRAGQHHPTIQIKCGAATDTVCRTAESRGYVTSSQAGAAASTDDTIVLCSDFFLFDHLRKQSCDDIVTSAARPLTGIGAPNTAQLLLHHFVRALARGGVLSLADGAANSVMLQSISDAPPRRGMKLRTGSENADSYAWLATWAYAVGLGDHGPARPRCLNLFRENVLSEVGVPPNVIEAEVQKRRPARAQRQP